MSRFACAVVLLAGCAGASSTAGPARTAQPQPQPQPPAAAAANAELSPALTPLAWWLGDWDDAGGNGSEHWVAAAGAIYGVSLHGKTFEVMVIDDGEGPGRPDGVLRFFAMPNGKRSVEFRQRTLGEHGATFANDEHDFPRTITYQLAADPGAPGGGGARLEAVLGGSKQESYNFKRGTSERAPELEAADLAFAAETGKRGVDGWVAAFDPAGGMMRRAGRVEYAAIADAMKPTLSAGRLDWAPVASGKSGDLGFTVGKATFTAAKPEDNWRSTYVTIWHRQPDGSWKVLFDTGRPVQEP
jgi:ketosteroid isomerase-like protein